MVQRAWLRLHRTDADIESLPAWLTTVTTRLCLDRLRVQIPVPDADITVTESAPDPADNVTLVETVGLALQVVVDRLTPRERVAFVLHNSFGFEFSTIAAVLDTTPASTRLRSVVAHAALPVCVGDHAGAAWFHSGEAKVLFDFTVVGTVARLTFRTEREVLARVTRAIRRRATR